MLRILIIITLIMAAIPVFNKVKDYVIKKEKEAVRDIERATKKMINGRKDK